MSQRFRLKRLDPIDTAVQLGFCGLLVTGILSVVGVLRHGVGRETAKLLEMPAEILYYSLSVAVTGFVGALAYNIVARYTGGIRIALQDEGREAARKSNAAGPIIVAPPEEAK